MDLTSEKLMLKPIKEWTEKETNYILSMIEFEAEQILMKNSYYKYYMCEKRKLIQPLVNKIYDEIFASFGKKVTVKIEHSEYDYIKQWATDVYVPHKKKNDYGYKGGDVGKAVGRLITGTCGNLAVVKYYGGSMADLDFSVAQVMLATVPEFQR